MASFAEAMKVEPIDSHTYRVQLKLEWSIGSVPHGGVVTSILMSVARQHFLTTLRAQNQPDCITLHTDFVQRTSPGAATVRVRDVKLGRQTSTVQLTLTQDGRDEVLAVLTHANLARESGVTLPTAWRPDALSPPPPPPADLARLAAHGADGAWRTFHAGGPNPEFRRASTQVDMYVPLAGRSARGVLDQWIKLRSGERFTHTALGFLSDMFPQMIESFSGDAAALAEAGIDERELPRHWYPTLALNLDVKRPLPEEGAKWIFARIQSKMIHNGRMDLEVVIMNEQMEIIALSHHVAMILNVSRNLAKRGEGGKDKAGGGSRL